MSYTPLSQVLTFLRGDLHCTFTPGASPKPAYAVFLKALGEVVSLSCDITARVSHQPGIIVSGSPRTFLKSDADLSYIPSGRLDRRKDAPYTVFARALYIDN